jgi:hypothetical protein
MKNNDTDANAKFETKLDTTKTKLLSLDQKLLVTRYKINQNCETMVEKRKKAEHRTLNHYSAPL